MATIVTNANWLQVDGARLQKGKWDLTLTGAGVRLSDAGQSINIPYLGTTIDGAAVESSAALFAFFEAQGFKSGGTGPGTGVQSVTGDGVGGTATNVVISYPSPGDIGAATAAQGALADTAVQPGDLPATPTWTTISGKPDFVAEGANAAAARTALGLGTAATTASTAYATAAQGTLANTAVQPAAIANMVESEQQGAVGTVITNIIALTQAEYDGLTPVASTYYIITD